MHTEWRDVISLADYIILASRQAVKMAIEADRTSLACRNRCTSNFGSFEVGRQTCSNPDVGVSQTLPHGHDPNGVNELTQLFDLTPRQAVALLGK